MIGVLLDVTRCTGCGECVQACVDARQLGEAVRQPQHSGDGLSAQRYAAIVTAPQGRPVRKFCRHCLEPACVSVCPVGAMQKTPEGPVIYDYNKCMGCRYCMMACPWGIPRYEWDSPAPRVQKCDLCYERLQAGELPACVQICPQQVLELGERSMLLAVAHERIQAQPDRYLPVVYGEHEGGGTSVLYISDVPLDFLAFHQLPPDTPLPELSAAWLGKVPALSLSTAGLMTGLFWIIGRRMQFEEQRRRHQEQKDKT